MTPPAGPRTSVIGDFDRALESLRSVRYRSELRIEESPAPQRLAPFAVALTAEVLDSEGDNADEVASGRFVLLHDPHGVDAWSGTFRVVSFVRALLEPDVAGDPLLTSVGWSWLVEALGSAGADYLALGGTVTRVTSEGFGSLESGDGVDSLRGHVEIRASWTPLNPPDEIAHHTRAWSTVLSTAAGLLPTPVSLS